MLWKIDKLNIFDIQLSTMSRQKIIYDSDKVFTYSDKTGKLRACYFPEIPIDDGFMEKLEALPFTRVEYISRFNKRNRTPRKTWAFGKVNSDIVTYTKRGQTLNFKTEPMPKFLQRLGDYCRKVAIQNWNFNPNYNSCIIGRYDNKNDSIGFHFDTETFLAHHFCANVTLGYSRDFQFKDEDKNIHQVALQDKSLFFFNALEHALPKRASVKEGEVRYSISFRNMNKDVGIANSYYYCRGLDGAIDDEDKDEYLSKLKEM